MDAPRVRAGLRAARGLCLEQVSQETGVRAAHSERRGTACCVLHATHAPRITHHASRAMHCMYIPHAPRARTRMTTHHTLNATRNGLTTHHSPLTTRTRAQAKADKDGVFIGAWDGLGGKVIHRSDVYPLRRESVTIQGKAACRPPRMPLWLCTNLPASSIRTSPGVEPLVWSLHAPASDLGTRLGGPLLPRERVCAGPGVRGTRCVRAALF